MLRSPVKGTPPACARPKATPCASTGPVMPLPTITRRRPGAAYALPGHMRLSTPSFST